MLISETVVNGLIRKLNSGLFTPGKFCEEIVKRSLSALQDILLNSLGDILPFALTVAGSILVVKLAWRLFRNFTRG